MASVVEFELYRRLADEAGRQYAGAIRELPSQSQLGVHFDRWLTEQGHKLKGATDATVKRLRRVFEAAVRSSKPAKANPRRRRRKANPGAAAAEVAAGFHGREPDKVHEYRVVEHVHKDLAGLGVLVSLRVRPATGPMVEIEPPVEGPKKIMLAASKDRSTLYLVGGDQEIDVKRFGITGNAARKDRVILGELRTIVYRTRKGFDRFELADYKHKLEARPVLPLLGYDTRSKLLYIEGGSYVVENRGIVD